MYKIPVTINTAFITPRHTIDPVGSDLFKLKGNSYLLIPDYYKKYPEVN